MTAYQKLLWCLLVKLQEYDSDFYIPQTITSENVEEIYEQCLEESGSLLDVKYEFREGEFETKLPAPYSRHYETKSVAAKCPDGSYIGWTYWYGGGKHGEPDAIDWMEEAYDLDCKEEERLVIVREFSFKKGTTNANV
jgi:hypothetical protein